VLGDDAQLHGAALEAAHQESVKGASRWRLRRLIIFTAHEPAGGVHARILLLAVGQWQTLPMRIGAAARDCSEVQGLAAACPKKESSRRHIPAGLFLR